MNGRLHLGHAFSLTKAEFAAGFKRLQGFNVLFPFGFHCTGMPIQAAANRLKGEIEQFGNPPVFPELVQEVRETSVEALVAKKGKAKKAKVAQKSGGSYQWESLEKMGVDDIASFSEPEKWLNYFPPYGVSDLRLFGTSIDWRRSFITTELNLFYDSFVRWQFRRLQSAGKIKFGKRANVYSVKDGQVCADHDRASGEGVGPQEYVLIKLRMMEVPKELEGRDVFLVPATLRPETMYGQTNCYVLPDGQYGAYEQASGEVFVMSRRAAVGLAHQGWFDDKFHSYAAELGKVKPLLENISGRDLLGCPLQAPLAKYSTIYVLPLTTISMSKGTGVVTSVPSDAADDWIALHELKEKEDMRKKYGVTVDMLFDVVPIISITVEGDEGWSSDVSAEFWCAKLDIKSQKDAVKLKQAKAETYLHGFNSGVMLVGDYKGKKVSEAKPLVKADMIAANQACLYFEPESLVMSRSGDECVVAHTDQWYLTYGEDAWRAAVEAHVDSEFEAYNAENLARFKYTLGWMREWACSRLFGLGTRIPWDPTWVIESLSDSTIYMAYYTVAHLLQGVDNLSGAQSKTLKPDDLTDAVWDYIFLKDAVKPANCPDVVDAMRSSFRYWYPMDLRVSGKDLIGNHLTMCLYNHAAVWSDEPELWPRSMYCNGFVLLDGEKMSKSTGNFLMLDEACKLYSADAVRFALADAGDTLEDANFERKRADAAVVMLFVEEEFARKVCEGGFDLRTEGDLLFMDRAFENELHALANETTHHYSQMRWRDGTIAGAFNLQLARDAYRDWCFRSQVPMRADLARKYVELAALMIAPICPHYAEHVWTRILCKATMGSKGPGSLRSKVWPDAFAVDKALSRAFKFLNKSTRALRLDVIKDTKSKPATHGYVYIASTYPDWKAQTLAFLRAACVDGTLAPKKDALAALKSHPDSPCKANPKQTKNMMQFAAFMLDYAAEIGLDALDESLPFDQAQVLTDSLAFFQNSLNPANKMDLVIYDLANTPDAPGSDKKKALASPGHPSIYVFTP